MQSMQWAENGVSKISFQVGGRDAEADDVVVHAFTLSAGPTGEPMCTGRRARRCRVESRLFPEWDSIHVETPSSMTAHPKSYYQLPIRVSSNKHSISQSSSFNTLNSVPVTRDTSKLPKCPLTRPTARPQHL